MQDPLVIGELKRLAEISGGVLQPRAVVEAARDVASPLHRFFEWDDGEAAERYRLQQARQLLSVAVTYEPRVERTIDVFQSLPADRRNPGGGYRLTVDILEDPLSREALLREARREMQSFITKYKSLAELAQLLDAMQEVVSTGSPAQAAPDDQQSASA